jgi:5-methylcytosine-specific restriction enzyme A
MYQFQPGRKYSREDVKGALGVAQPRGGNWDTGYAEHDGVFFLFANVGVPGRTGHDYENRWVSDDVLEWYAKGPTLPEQPQVQRLLAEDATVHLFWRDDSDAPFIYAGQCSVIDSANEKPVRVWWKITSNAGSSRSGHKYKDIASVTSAYFRAQRGMSLIKAAAHEILANSRNGMTPPNLVGR